MPNPGLRPGPQPPGLVLVTQVNMGRSFLEPLTGEHWVLYPSTPPAFLLKGPTTMSLTLGAE